VSRAMEGLLASIELFQRLRYESVLEQLICPVAALSALVRLWRQSMTITKKSDKLAGVRRVRINLFCLAVGLSKS
jgi:hypothetical protein